MGFKRHKKVEENILTELRRNADSEFVALPNKFSHIDLAGKIKDVKVVVEVKERLTDVNHGDGFGWVIEKSKIDSMCSQIRELGADPKDVDVYYCNIWAGNVYLFDVKEIDYKNPANKTMNAKTVFSGPDKEKISKEIYYLRNQDCLLHRNDITLDQLFKLY